MVAGISYDSLATDLEFIQGKARSVLRDAPHPENEGEAVAITLKLIKPTDMPRLLAKR